MRSIGPYRLLRRVGHGGMAEVWLALAFGASGFEKRVAIKILLPDLRGVREYEQLIIDEAVLGARLQHRNLVQVLGLGVEEGAYYVCMEWVDGADLETLCRRGRPPAALALLVAEEIALALEYVHAAADERGRPLGLVHRDVSPSNVLVSRSGEVKLADFGIAKATVLADVTRANVRKGKYAYMSPEQVAGEPLSPSSDQFGLGVTLMELLCGRRPFDGDSVMATLDNIRRAAPPELPELAADLRAVVLGCLARHPAGRFPGAEALRQAIAAARRDRAPAAAPDLAAWVAARLAETA